MKLLVFINLVRFQVIKGHHDQGFKTGMMVNFEIFDKNNELIKSFVDETTGRFTFNARGDGDHKLCLYSYLGDKTVFVEVTVSDPTSKEEEEDVYAYEYEEDEDFLTVEMKEMQKRDQESVKSQFDTTVKDIKKSLQEIRQNLHKASLTQGFLMSTLTKDMFIMTSNFNRVNLWSAVYIMVLILTGLTQVFVIRKLFEDKSPQKLKTTT